MVLSFLGVTAFGAELSEQALSHASPRVYEVVTVKEAVTPDLISMLDVLGTAVGQEDSGELAM